MYETQAGDAMKNGTRKPFDIQIRRRGLNVLGELQFNPRLFGKSFEEMWFWL
jgi:hypothetical protein